MSEIIDLDNQKHFFALGLIFILGGMAFFQAGIIFSGVLDSDQQTQSVMSPEKVSDKVENYVSVTSGDRANVTVTGVERSDQLESFYKVGVTLSTQILNQTRTQETTVLVSRDGEYILSGQPQDLDNPQPPQPRPQPSINPETQEEEQETNQTQ